MESSALAALLLLSKALSRILFFPWTQFELMRILQRQPIAHFVALHNKNVDSYRIRLENMAKDLEGRPFESDDVHDKLHDLLHRYCESVADLEQMNRRQLFLPPKVASKRGWAFGDADSNDIKIISIALAKSGTVEDSDAREASVMFAINTFANFIVAIIVGGALIAPMLIMVLNPSRNTSLITTSVFVFTFALALVIVNALAHLVGSKLDSTGSNSNTPTSAVLQLKDIVGATAAYAAVLVVFVGLSTPT